MTAAEAASLNSWELVAEIATLAVIIGVAGEGIEIALKFLKLRFEANHKTDASLIPPKHITWINRHEMGLEVWGGIFWMLVVLGLVFEWRGSHKAKDITDREARRLTTQLEATTEKAGEASERAGLAEQRAAEAEKEVEQLRQTNLVLETKLVQLKADTLPRRITQRQKERFIDLLTHGVVSKCPIKVLVALPADSETTHFALKLREMLDEAGFGTNHESIIGVPYLSNVPQEQNYEKPLDWVLAVYFSPTNQPPNFTDPPAVAVLTNAPNGRLYSQMPFASFSQVANARPIELIPSGQRALVGYFPTKQPTLIMFGVSEVLWGIGIRVGLMPSDRGILVKPGEVAFLVPPRIY